MFGKVFSTLFEGTMLGMAEEQLVFVYLLSYADRKGFVRKNETMISFQTGLSVERVDEALAVLESPDPKSHSKDSEGRRLERVAEDRSSGWRIVTYEKYRAIRDEDERREQTRLAVARHRERQRTADPESGDGEAAPPLEGAPRRPKPEEEPEGFADFWLIYPRKVARRAAAKAFHSALGRHDNVDHEDLLAAAGVYSRRISAEGKEPQFTPHPATWLNQDRFMEEFEDESQDQV